MFAKTRLALLVGWVTGGVAFPLLAQETTKNETIVVTSQMQSGATKIATPDIETPQSVSIITREQFEEDVITGERRALPVWSVSDRTVRNWLVRAIDAAGRDGSSGSDTGLRRARMAAIAASRASVDATGRAGAGT